MKRSSTTLVVLTVLAIAPVAQDSTREGLDGARPVVVEITAEHPALAGHGGSQSFPFTPPARGTLIVWATSEEVDAHLRVEDGTGPGRHESDGTRDGAAAFLSVPVEAGQELTVHVACADPEATGTLVVRACLVSLLDSEGREVIERANARVAEGRAQARGGAWEEGRASVRDGVDELLELFKSSVSETAPAPRPPEELLVALSAAAYTAAFEVRDPGTAIAVWERVVRAHEDVLPPFHDALQRARFNLALALKSTGELARAAELETLAVDAFEHTLPPEHPDSLRALENLAGTQAMRGRLDEAAALFERVYAVRAGSLPEEHADLQKTRVNLGSIWRMLGRPMASRAILEEAVEVLARTGPEDAVDLLKAQENLAMTLKNLGDFAGARELQEHVLTVYESVLPEGHPKLQTARMNLAGCLGVLGDHEAEVELLERVLAVRTRTLPEDHPYLQRARINLVGPLERLGEDERALELVETAIRHWTSNVPHDNPDLVRAHSTLARLLAIRGDLVGARDHFALTVERWSRSAPEQPDLQLARAGLALALAELGEFERAFAVLETLAVETATSLRATAFSSSPRELEARAVLHASAVSRVLSLTRADALSEPAPAAMQESAFMLVESVRGMVLLGSIALARLGGREGVSELREVLRDRSAEVARLTRTGTPTYELHEAIRSRENAQAELLRTVAELAPTAELLVEPRPGTIAARLGAGVAAIAYRKYVHWTGWTAQVPSYVAWVVRRDAPLVRVELGPAAQIDTAVAAWREALTASAPDERARDAGSALRALAFDPLTEALGEDRRLLVVADGALHLVPFDALPQGSAVLGENFEIQFRSSLWELLVSEPPPTRATLFVGAGGIDYDRLGDGEATGSVARLAPSATILRSGPWTGGYTFLDGTRSEVREIGALAEASGVEDLALLEGAAASRDVLVRLAPRARYLHLATHGFFADPAVPPSSRVDALASPGRWASTSDRLRRLSPMALCGLALSGANLPPSELDRSRGGITAEELAALDLRGCDLAVLSACDTSRGELRGSGQSVASLRRALHQAGARSVITSLWRVDDAATRLLMVELYRRLWVLGEPKHQALWNAKTWLRGLSAAEVRSALDLADDGAWSAYARGLRGVGVPPGGPEAEGHPYASPRYWAGWTLTGDPD